MFIPKMQTLRVYKIIIFLIIASLISACSQSAVSQTPTVLSISTPNSIVPYIFNNGVLTISTKLMEVKIEHGAIVYVKDLASDELLVDYSAFHDNPSLRFDFIGLESTGLGPFIYHRLPARASTVSFELLENNKGRLVYSFPFLGGAHSDTEIVLEISIDDQSGEVILQLSGQESSHLFKPTSVDIPILGIATSSIILGSGAKYLRSEADKIDQTTYVDYGLYSPSMAVAEGLKASLAVWSESTQYSPEYIRLEHKPAFDNLVLHSQQAPGQEKSQVISSPPWRIGTYSTWNASAKRWREKFEERTGAKPLWENNTTWVRKIHVVFDATNQDYGGDESKYANLATRIPPEHMLFFLWNGDRLVLFGDPTLVDKIARPSLTVQAMVKKYGWPFLLYHPYNLINSEDGTASRLTFLTNQGWLPQNYQYKPDYSGSPEDWQRYWSNIKANYYDGSQNYILHPGAKIFQDYVVQNLGDYLSIYSANGAYLDILGADHSFLFPSDRKIVDGSNYVIGEVKTLQKLREDFPQFAFMSEYQSPWILPYVFFSWEGAETHIKQIPVAHTRLNHPLRVALTGSYAWTRETNYDTYDDIYSALMGALPVISLTGDYNISDEEALWSQRRAELFSSEELFNDIPNKWDPEALAYYRGKNGHWFKFIKIGSGYGYVEELPDGTDVIRLQK